MSRQFHVCFHRHLGCKKPLSPSPGTAIVELQLQGQQQQTRPLPAANGHHQCYFPPPTFLKFRFRVLFWRHSRSQLIGPLNDQILAFPESISSRQKHLRHRSQSQGEAENGLPAAGHLTTTERRSCAAFKCSSSNSYKQGFVTRDFTNISSNFVTIGLILF